jgi:hypothetical protein
MVPCDVSLVNLHGISSFSVQISMTFITEEPTSWSLSGQWAHQLASYNESSFLNTG